jgi:mannosyltransferase OCH1-like enzyme
MSTGHLIQYWHSASPPEDVAELCQTFPQQNPDLVYRRFDESTAEKFIEANFSERECSAFRACAVRAMQSDYLRYCAVLAHGGVYCDVDHRCVAPLSPLLNGSAGGKLYVRPDENVINGFFAFAHADHPLLRYALEAATTAIELRLAEDVWLTTGPGVFTMLHHLATATSEDEFMGWWTDDRDENIRRCAQNLCNVVDDREKLKLAFADVDVAPYSEVRRWVPRASVGYKESHEHWTKVTSSIFR